MFVYVLLLAVLSVRSEEFRTTPKGINTPIQGVQAASVPGVTSLHPPSFQKDTSTSATSTLIQPIVLGDNPFSGSAEKIKTLINRLVSQEPRSAHLDVTGVEKYVESAQARKERLALSQSAHKLNEQAFDLMTAHDRGGKQETNNILAPLSYTFPKTQEQDEQQGQQGSKSGSVKPTGGATGVGGGGIQGLKELKDQFGAELHTRSPGGLSQETYMFPPAPEGQKIRRNGEQWFLAPKNRRTRALPMVETPSAPLEDDDHAGRVVFSNSLVKYLDFSKCCTDSVTWCCGQVRMWPQSRPQTASLNGGGGEPLVSEEAYRAAKADDASGPDYISLVRADKELNTDPAVLEQARTLGDVVGSELSVIRNMHSSDSGSALN